MRDYVKQGKRCRRTLIDRSRSRNGSSQIERLALAHSDNFVFIGLAKNCFLKILFSDPGESGKS